MYFKIFNYLLIFSGRFNSLLLLLCVVPKTMVLCADEYVVPSDLLSKESAGASTKHNFGGTKYVEISQRNVIY